MVTYNKSLTSFDPTKYLLPALFFVLPFHRTFSIIIIYTLAVVLIVRAIQLKMNLGIHVHWFLPTLYFYFVISVLIFGGGLSVMDTQLNLLVIPILMGLQSKLYSFDQKTRERVFLAYVIGISVVEVLCIVVATAKSISFHDARIFFNPKVFPDADYDFLTSSVRDGNFFFGEEFSLVLHPIYFSLYIVVAQLIAFQEFRYGKIEGRKRYWLIVFYLFQFPILFLLSSKASIILSLTLTAWLVIWTLRHGSKIRLLLMMSGVVVVGYLFVSFNPRMRIFKNTFFERLKINPNARFGHDLRVLSWDASWEIIKNNLWTGVGEVNKNQALVDVYARKGYIIPERYRYNSHNQFLDFLISGGVWAFGLFILGLLSLFRRAIRDGNEALIIFLVLFVINALFENLLYRYAGVLFFSLFTTFLLNNSPHQIRKLGTNEQSAS